MPPPTATTLSQAFAKFRSSLTHTLLLCVFVAVATGAGANLDSTGKKSNFLSFIVNDRTRCPPVSILF